MLRDDYDFLVQMNQAQLIGLHEGQLLPVTLIKNIASGIDELVQRANQSDAVRQGDYLAFERELVNLVGSDASNLHLGRSRNDIGATRERLWMRQDLLRILDSLLDSQKALLTLAGEHVATVMATYTHAVQAQPTSLAHYLLALASNLRKSAWAGQVNC